MSPLKKNKLGKIRNDLDKLDNSLIKIIKKRTSLVKKVLIYIFYPRCLLFFNITTDRFLPKSFSFFLTDLL